MTVNIVSLSSLLPGVCSTSEVWSEHIVVVLQEIIQELGDVDSGQASARVVLHYDVSVRHSRHTAPGDQDYRFNVRLQLSWVSKKGVRSINRFNRSVSFPILCQHRYLLPYYRMMKRKVMNMFSGQRPTVECQRLDSSPFSHSFRVSE